jgi:elongation factor G
MAKTFQKSDLRNVCFIGGNGSGKTSLAESVFFYAGVTTRCGSVGEGNTVCDYNEDEIERKISINLAVGTFEHSGKKITLIDTPGYLDFIGEVISGVKAADSAVFIAGADAGVEGGTGSIWETFLEERKPVIFFFNKLDKENLDVENAIKNMENSFDIKLTPLNLPLGGGVDFTSYVDLLALKKVKVSDNKPSAEPLGAADDRVKKARETLIDAVASCDDALMEKYLEGKEITEQELLKGLRSGFSQGKIYPLIFGSALRSVGTSLLMDFITQYAPEPAVLGGDSDQPLALIFKTTSEPGMGQINYVKVYSGKITAGADLYNFTKNAAERVGQIASMLGNKRSEAHAASAGDIAVLIKLKNSRTNDVLADHKMPEEKVQALSPIKFPPSYLDMAIYARSKGEEEKIGTAIQVTALEEPTVRFQFNPETKEMIVSGIGNLQLEITTARIKKRYGVNIELKAPRIPYKETVKGRSEVQGKFKRQSGGRGQYGDCWLKIEPNERGKGFLFIDKIFGGAIPKNFIPSVEKGVIEAMSEGVIAGYPVTDVQVTLSDGSYHEVDSSDMAFKIAGAMALRKGVTEAKPAMLEPLTKLEVTVPETYLGSVMGDLNSRRGRVLGMDKAGKKQVVKAQVPLAEAARYAIDLRSMTKGAGKFIMSFSHYEELPAHLARPLIDEYQKSKKQEE